jgi:hypothetical protein
MDKKGDNREESGALSPSNRNWFLGTWWVLTIILILFVAPYSGMFDAAAWGLLSISASSSHQSQPQFTCLTGLWPIGMVLGFLMGIGLSVYGARALWLKGFRARRLAEKVYAIAIGVVAIQDIFTAIVFGMPVASLFRLPVLLGLFLTHQCSMEYEPEPIQEADSSADPPPSL